MLTIHWNVLWPLVLVAMLTSCVAEAPNSDDLAREADWGDPELYPDLGGSYASLTALVGTCTWVSATGTMTIDAGDTAQTIIIGKRSVDSAILVNGATCGSPAATSVTLKRLNMTTGMANVQTVIIDFIAGLFAPGTTTARGMNIDLGAGATDAVRIRGTTGVDTLTFGGNGLSFNTDAFRDIDVANVESFSVSLGTGADVFSGAGGNGTTGAFTTAVTVFGGDDADTLTGGDAADTINGGAGADTLAGGLGADALNGDAGNDTFNQGAATDGGDTLTGGTETDSVSYALRTLAVTVTVGAGANDGEAGEADDVGVTCETVVGGAGNDSLTGDANANTLTGGAGNDTLVGGAGADVLNGDAGDDTFSEEAATNGGDTFNGGAGTDTVDYSLRTAALTVTMDGVTADDGLAGELDNVKADVENLLGGTAADNITGNALANVLTGGLGADVLSGGAGADTFAEGTVTNGGDVFNGGADIDTVDYSLRTAALTVTMDGVAADDGLAGETDNVKADVENLYAGSAIDSITGNDAANIITGGAGVDTLTGGLGADELFGDAGNDVMNGDAGDDILDGGTGDNTLNCGTGDDIAYNNGLGVRNADCEL